MGDPPVADIPPRIETAPAAQLDAPDRLRAIVVTQLIYVHADHEADFLEFEARVLPRLALYGGELILRLRPAAAAFIAGSCDPPYEVHVVSFPSDDAMRAYSSDDVRQAALHLKNGSVKSTLVVRGEVFGR